MSRGVVISTMSTQASEDTYTIHHITLPEDTLAIQSIFTRSFASNALSSDTSSSSNTLTQTASFAAHLRAIQQRNALEGRNKQGMRSVAAKLVHNNNNKIAGVLCLLAPARNETEANAVPQPPYRNRNGFRS